jgi:hypothetical protein
MISYKQRETGGVDEHGSPISNFVKISPAVLESLHSTKIHFVSSSRKPYELRNKITGHRVSVLFFSTTCVKTVFTPTSV